MARRKLHSRGGEQMFTDPREAARHTRDLLRRGATPDMGTRHAMEDIGIQPHHWLDKASPTRKMSDAESKTLARQTDAVSGPVPVTYRPTSSSNPSDPRTSGAGYDPVTQRLYVEWGDGGPAYYYYDVTPQEWDTFQQVDSPGKYINAVLNGKNYGPA